MPCAQAFETVNVACRPVTKHMAIVSPDQYPFSLVYIKPNSTASPRESEHLKAKTKLWLVGIMSRVLQVLLKLAIAWFCESLDASVSIF